MDRFDFSERVAKYPLVPYRCVPTNAPHVHSVVLFSRRESSDGHLLGNYTRLGDVLAERRGQDEFVRRERVLGANGIQRRGVVEAYRASTLERRSAELRAKK